MNELNNPNSCVNTASRAIQFIEFIQSAGAACI
jgi:hypothetical protein